MSAPQHRCARCGTDKLSPHNTVCLGCAMRRWCGPWSRSRELFRLRLVRDNRRGVES